MGEIADMMLDGDLCAGCGGFIDDAGGDGLPRYCGSCDPEGDAEEEPITKHVRCTVCNKKLKPVGLAQHMADKHGVGKLKPAKTPAPKSLRDEFAMAALHGLLANPEGNHVWLAKEWAAEAYAFADAMMEVRKS